MITGIALWASLLSAMEPYGVKPLWWDDIAGQAVLHPEGSLQELYSKTREATLERFSLPLRDWLILGPLPAPDGLSTSSPLDEQGVFQQDDQLTDDQGQPLRWANLEAKKEAASDVFSSGNFIAYLANIFETPRSGPCWLVIQHDDGAKLWFNGTAVYENNRNRNRNLNDRVRVRAEKPGRQNLFVKLHQKSGNWGVNVDAYGTDPLWVDTFAWAYALTRPSAMEDKNWLGYSQRLVNRFVELEDLQNAMHWQMLRYPEMSQRDQDQLLQWIAARAGTEPDLLPLADTFFEELLIRNPELELIKLHLDFLEEAQDPVRLRRRLTRYLPVLREQAQFEADFRMLRLHLLEGDLSASRELIRRLKRGFSELENNETFLKLEEEVEEMRRRIAQVNLDWDFEGAVRQAGRLSESDPNELNRYLRQVMTDKTDTLQKTDEANLFVGSGRLYQQAFAKYADAYEEDLGAYLNLLEKQLGLSPQEKEARLRQLSLSPEEPPTPEREPPPSPTAAALTLPRPSSISPLIEMVIGSRELMMESPELIGPVERAPPASILSRGDQTVLQNSRSLAMLSGSVFQWTHVWENSHLRVGDEEITPWHRELVPVLDGDQVFARILHQGVYQVIAADARSGEIQWAWEQEDRVVCTNPVVWGNSVIIVVRTSGQIAQYHLVFLHRTDGSVQKELTLLSSTSKRYFHPAGTHVELDHYMSDPVLKGNTLYLQTNNGVLAAVDLGVKRFHWLRTYPLKSRFGKESEGRRITRPVVIQGLVVFSPFDGRAVFSVDTRTGQLVTQMGTFDWKDIRPYGDKLLILDAKGAAQVVDPESLEVEDPLNGSGYRFVTGLRDGAILQKGQSLELWSEKQGLLATETLPDAMTALSVNDDNAFFYRKDAITPWVYSTLSASESPPMRNTTSSSASGESRFISGSDGLYVITQNTVEKRNGSGDLLWSVPHAHTGSPEQIRFFEAGPRVYVVTKAGVEVLNAESGAAEERFPRPGESRRPVQDAMLFGNTLAFTYPDRDDLRRADRQRVLMEGTTLTFSPPISRRNMGDVLGFRNDGETVLTIHRDELRAYQLDGDTNEWSLVQKTPLTKSRWRSFRSLDKNISVWARHNRLGVINAQGEWTDIRLNNKERRHKGIREGFRGEQWIDPLYIYRLHADYWDAVDLIEEKDLGHSLDSDTRPILHEGMLHGFSINRTSVTHRKVDVETGSAEEGATLNVSRTDWNRRYIRREQVSFLYQDKIYVMLYVAGREERQEEFPVVILDPRTGELTEKTFPNPGEVYNVKVWEDFLWLATEAGTLRLPVNTFMQLMEQSPHLKDTQVPAPEDLQIDGVLPEWEDSAFLKAGNNQLIACQKEGSLILAGAIRNEAFIRAVGTQGIDRRVTLHLYHGPDASFSPSGGLHLNPSIPGDGIELAYFVSPTGRELFFEARISEQHLQDQGLNLLQQKVGNKIRGDLAFDFSIETGLGQPRYAIAEHPWPVWFARFRLTSP